MRPALRLRDRAGILVAGVVLIILVGPDFGFAAGTIYFAILAVW